MNGEHHDDTQTETLLAALVEDLRARETDWSSYAEGQRSAEEVCASRRAAGDDEAEIEATLALYQPMDPGKRAALLEQLECWPERTGASPKRAPERKTAWLGAVLALAAAAVLMVVARPLLSPAPAPQVSALPSFVLSTDTGGAELRSASKPPGPLAAQPAPLRYRPAHRFDWRLRPAEPVEAVLELGICAQPEHGPVRLISADPFVETAPSGAMRLRGQIAALGLEPGAWRLTLIVRPRASLPFDAASCDVADSPAQRVAHLELRVE